MMLLKGTYKKVDPASGAIIMANGIFLIGAIEAFPILDLQMGKYLAFILLVSWIFIYKRLSVQFFHYDFFSSFIKNPVHSFVIGTWIAGVSVLCNVFLKYFPITLPIIQAIAILNTFLWLFFLVSCIYNFRKLLIANQNHAVHGVILLSTVATQSIIILLNNVFFQFPTYFSEAIIILGCLFYFAGITLMINGYVRQTNWSFVDDWSNTNCIIHGGLSITGLAIVSTNTFTTDFMTAFWLIVFFLLILVEIIELTRAVMRIKLYGWKDGIFRYDITQWSRNFTFGMFYTFTFVMHNNSFYLIPDQLDQFQMTFMSFWAWIVLITLVGQLIIYVKFQLETMYMGES